MGQLPEQARQMSERANEYFAQLNTPADNPEATPPAEPKESAPAESVVPAATEQPAEQHTEQPANAEPPADTAPKPENWEHKYRTLQGLFNAESRAWQAEKKTFEARIQALDNAAKAPAPQPQPAATKQSRVTDKDLDTYGPELLDVIGRKAAEMADEIVAQRLAELRPALEETRERVTTVAGQVYKNAQDRFYGELTQAVPDWQAVNTDQRWLDWLGETDPLSGVPRQVYLDNASQKLEYERVARLFQTFKDHAGLNKPAAPAPAKPTLSPSPRTVGSATAPTPREPDTRVSRSEISAHYRRSSTDQSYRTSKDHDAMEQRIATAMATGAIVEA